jgi:hypothetical protein
MPMRIMVGVGAAMIGGLFIYECMYDIQGMECAGKVPCSVICNMHCSVICKVHFTVL